MEEEHQTQVDPHKSTTSSIPNNNNNNLSSSSSTSSSSEPVRSRWTPKPEQILILESIFNSGMVNPTKEETIRIRKLLEKFGAVGDANVFYWFQNRRSRSRRRQRQLQASLNDQQGNINSQQYQQQEAVGGVIQQQQSYHNNINSGLAMCYGSINNNNNNNNNCVSPSLSSSFFMDGSCSSSTLDNCGGSAGAGAGGGGNGGLFQLCGGQMGFPEIEQTSIVTPVFSSPDASNLQFQTGLMTVFINGVATEIPKGCLDMKAMFGEDVVLVHSSGIPVLINDFGFTLQSLQPGESYFLVSRSI